MIAGEKLGIGIVTYNREINLINLINSLPLDLIDSIIIINDGEIINESNIKNIPIINNQHNIGVGCSKNKALKYLIEKKIDHFFIIEDDIFIKNKDVFSKYIEASKISGIQHFNFALHGNLNLTPIGSPNVKINLNFGKVNLDFYQNCVGAFSYYSKLAIDTVGLFDENYYNALEHLDHTFLICQKNLHPSYWFFADIRNSSLYIGDETWSEDQSVILRNTDKCKNLSKAETIFFKKYSFSVYKIKKYSILHFLKSLQKINIIYGENINFISLSRKSIYSYLLSDINKNLIKFNLARLLKSFLLLFFVYFKILVSNFRKNTNEID